MCAILISTVTIKSFNFVVTFTNVNRNKKYPVLLVSLPSFGHYFMIAHDGMYVLHTR